jgi:predicted ester cyclase
MLRARRIIPYYRQIVEDHSLRLPSDCLTSLREEEIKVNEWDAPFRTGAKAHIVGVRQTFPDLHITIEQQIAEGEWVVPRITAIGTHKGSWIGMKPTNRPVVITGVNVDRVVDGRIVEHGGAANMLGPLLEIGAIKVIPDS